MILLPALLLSHVVNHLVSPALAMSYEDYAAAPCYGGYPTAAMPEDGSNIVSPKTIPAVTVNVSCGSGSITATLTADAGAPTSVTLDVHSTSIVWLTDLPLAADTSYTLAIEGEDADMGGLTSVFSTGSDPLSPLTGVPSLTVDGASLSTQGYAAVTLDAFPVADPSGAFPMFDVLRDGNAVAGSINGTTFFLDAFQSADGQEICYSVRQYNADSSVYATSEEDCVELVMDEDTSQAGCFGREKRTSGGSVAAMLFGFGLLRRKRLGGNAS